MTPERWRQVEELYHAALGYDVLRRHAFLIEACQGDDELHLEVESLLEASQSGNDVLQRPAWEDAASLMETESREMALVAGTHVGPYEIVGVIGVGGMGEVYRARDNRLNRDVAVKVLPRYLANDPDRLRWFKVEAHSTGALNHPNILAIYDIGTHDGAPYIVSELLEGESLRACLQRGKLNVAKAIGFARQIATGLAAAHANGITHRDIKPENLFIIADDRVKILDFGLAKMKRLPTSVDKAPVPTKSLTTRPGLLVGTIAYMSPEQVRGEAVDHRSDIFSFGCVLYEMLTGQRTFSGSSPVETMNAILKQEPPDLVTFDNGFPPVLVQIVKRCLKKNGEQRFQSAADLAFNLETVSQISSAGITPATRRFTTWKLVLASSITLSAIALVAATAVVWIKPPEPMLRPSSHLTITLPPDAPLAPLGLMPLGFDRPALALSPDGARLVYAAQIGGNLQLCVRDMATARVTPLAGTEGGHTPFFSPDGAFVGFFSNGKLRKTSITGGAPVALTDVSNPHGAVWGTDSIIYFNRQETEGIHKVPAAGGPVEVAVTLQSTHAPEFLAPGPQLLVSSEGSILYVDGRQTRKFIVPGFYPRYIPTGHLVYARHGTLNAVQFDPRKIVVTGDSLLLFEGVRTGSSGIAQFTLSREGTLVYALGQPYGLTSLVWVDRKGRTQPLGLPERRYYPYDLSPDGERLAVSIPGDGPETSVDIWIYDLSHATMSRLTPRITVGRPYRNMWPRWTPEGRHIIYAKMQGSESKLLWAPVDGSAEPVELWSSKPSGPLWLYPMSFSPDRSVVTVFGPSPNSSMDLWLMRLDGIERPVVKSLELFLGTPFADTYPQISPDGRWMLYTSDRSGRYEIYVTSYPKPGATFQISRDGGVDPLWNPAAPEIVYANGRQMYTVSVTLGSEFHAGEPRLLFKGSFLDIPGFGLAISRDGQRFLMPEKKDLFKTSQTLTVITNFSDELRRRFASQNTRH